MGRRLIIGGGHNSPSRVFSVRISQTDDLKEVTLKLARLREQIDAYRNE